MSFSNTEQLTKQMWFLLAASLLLG